MQKFIGLHITELEGAKVISTVAGCILASPSKQAVDSGMHYERAQ